MNLYDIDSALDNLLTEAEHYASEHEGEYPVDLAEQIDKLEMDRNTKIDNCIRFVKNKSALCDAISQEKKALERRLRTYENSIDFIKSMVGQVLGENQKYEVPIGKVSWRKSESVEVVADVPDTLCTFERKISKTKIKDFILENGEQQFAKIVIKNNIQIK